MKTQMRFQKIFMLIALIIAALCVVFAFIFCSGTLFQMQNAAIFDLAANPPPEGDGIEYLEGAKDLFWASQGVSNTVLVLGIVLILAVVLNYIMGSAKRRKYYVTNYVATGIAVVAFVAVAIVILVLVLNCQNILATIDLEQAEEIYNTYADGWQYSVWTFSVGYALSGVLLITALVFVLNLVWKIKLMKGEKKLLESGLAKEVA